MGWILEAAAYAYSYGLVSAMPQYLDAETYARLINALSPEAAITELMKTHYEKRIKEVISKGKSEDLGEIEKAVVGHYFDICNAIINTFPKKVREVSRRVLLDEFDVGNLKRILRALKAKSISGKEKTIDEILADCIGGNIKEEILREIASADFKTAIDKIRNLGFHIEGESLFDIENSLDINLMNRWRKDIEKVKEIESFVKRRIDVLNLKAIIRMKILGIDTEDFIKKTCQGAYLNFKILNAVSNRKITKENIEIIHEFLKNTPYENLFTKVFEEFKKTKSIDRFELEIESAFTSPTIFTNPVSLEYILTYLRRMWFDVRNIRVLLVGKKYGISNEEIKRMMILQ